MRCCSVVMQTCTVVLTRCVMTMVPVCASLDGREIKDGARGARERLLVTRAACSDQIRQIRQGKQRWLTKLQSSTTPREAGRVRASSLVDWAPSGRQRIWLRGIMFADRVSRPFVSASSLRRMFLVLIVGKRHKECLCVCCTCRE